MQYDEPPNFDDETDTGLDRKYLANIKKTLFTTESSATTTNA